MNVARGYVSLVADEKRGILRVAAVAGIALAVRQSLDTAGGLRVATPGMRERECDDL